LGRHGERPAQALVPPGLQVGAQRPRLGDVEAGGDDARRHQPASPAVPPDPASTFGVGPAGAGLADTSAGGGGGPPPAPGAPAGSPTARATRQSVPWGGTVSPSRPVRRSSTSRSKSSWPTLPKNRQLTARQGASPQRAMHSTSSSVNSPSSVVPPALTPRRRSACSSSS